MVFSSYEIMTFWYYKIHTRCLNTHLIGIMNEVATVLEVEVAWAMVLPSYETYMRDMRRWNTILLPYLEGEKNPYFYIQECAWTHI